MKADEGDEVVMAADILAWAENPENSVDVEVVDDEDLYPELGSVEVEVDDETHVCSLSADYYYREDSARYGLSCGRCTFTILGVEFSTPYDDHSDVEISGKDVDYGDMDEEEFWDELKVLVDIPEYDPFTCSYEFDENEVTDEDLKDNMECEFEVFALNADGEVCAFESENDVPGFGERLDDEALAKAGGPYEIIDEDEAFSQLASDRPGLTFTQRG